MEHTCCSFEDLDTLLKRIADTFNIEERIKEMTDLLEIIEQLSD